MIIQSLLTDHGESFVKIFPVSKADQNLHVSSKTAMACTTIPFLSLFCNCPIRCFKILRTSENRLKNNSLQSTAECFALIVHVFKFGIGNNCLLQIARFSSSNNFVQSWHSRKEGYLWREIRCSSSSARDYSFIYGWRIIRYSWP